MTELEKDVILRWRRHLATEEGMKGMLFLREKIPSITKADQHQMIFDAARLEGFKECLNVISELLTLDKSTKEIDIENR